MQKSIAGVHVILLALLEILLAKSVYSTPESQLTPAVCLKALAIIDNYWRIFK
jgi:hypothetical protein